MFAGDPVRGIAPYAVCHRPEAQKLGAPAMQGQQSAYIQRQLTAFAPGTHRNDINEEMRTISEQLTANEKRAVAI